MFAQESVMEIQRQAFQEWYIANHHDGDIHPNQQLLEWSEKGGFYFASSVEDLWEAWQAAKAQAVPEGFVLVEKKEFEQMQEFEDLYRRAIFNSKKSIHEVNWSHVSNLGVGSTRAKAMCKRFNIDPEATFRKPQEPTSD